MEYSEMKQQNNRNTKPDQPERMLLALLKAALNRQQANTCCFENVSTETWEACRKLATTQGVTALAWDGVLTLPAALQPPKALKLNWAMAVENYERRYRRYCRLVAELSDFYARHGICMVQMKGVGLSACYPVPQHREGGDIDIFTYSANPEQMSDREANRMADTLMEEQGIKVDKEHSEKHSLFYYKGIPVENHKTFLNVKQYRIAKQTDPLLREWLQPAAVTLDGKHRVLTPSATFNTVFLAFHAAQHYGRGLALHHLCDWACLINRHGLHIPDEITDRRLRGMMDALTRLCNEYLGTDVPVEGGKEPAAEILREMLRPRFAKEVPAHSKWGILAYKTRRFLHTYRLCNSVLGVSFFRCAATSVISHLLHPHTIFERTAK